MNILSPRTKIHIKSMHCCQCLDTLSAADSYKNSDDSSRIKEAHNESGQLSQVHLFIFDITIT